MTDCKKTKLKAEVNYDSPKILGAITASFDLTAAPVTIAIEVKTGETVEIVDAEGGTITYKGGSSDKLVFNGAGYIYYTVSIPSGKFIIKNKYAIKKCILRSSYNYNLNEFEYSDELRHIELETTKTISGSIKSLQNLPLEYLSIYSSGYTGNIQDLSMPTITTLKMQNSAREGEIKGSVEEFVATQIAKGRTSVTYNDAINFVVYGHQVTFGNSAFKTEYYSWLYWDSASKITIVAGDTVKDSYKRIYVKGATAEEIAAWEQAGKTVSIID